MNAVAKSMLMTCVVATIFIFYIAGIDAFPDYGNYLNIAENQGFLSEGDYLFEWFSRFILSLDGVNPVERVELLAVLNQIGCCIYFCWLIFKQKSPKAFGALFLFSLFGFMFMTTTLRASVAYLCISAFFLRGGRLDLGGIILLIFSVAWHDSALPIVLISILALAISKYIKSEKLSSGFVPKLFQLLTISAGAMVVLADLLRPMLADFGALNVGARAAYFESNEAGNLFKMIFVLLTLASGSAFAADMRQTMASRIFIVLLGLVIAAFYVINETVGVRFAFFMFVVTLPLREVVIFDFEKSLPLRLLALLVLPVTYYASMLYTFSNAVG